MLAALAGRAHDVVTGVAVASSEREEVFVERTTVWFSSLSDADIDDYVASGEPLDKAGAYAIQGLASKFVLRIAGSYTNVVGLPVARTWEVLRRFPGMRVASFSGGPYPD
jgi:septum formation protein